MISLFISFAVLIVGYIVYGKVTEKIFAPDDRETPAIAINDGVDCVPMKTWKAFLIQLLTRHSFKSKERIRNQKAYIVDTGLQGNRDNVLAPENLGWRLENVVYIELLRRCANDFLDVYYYKPSPRAKEVDFVVCDQTKTLELIQVAYEIDSPKAYDRETSSLVKAANALSCSHLTLIAFSPTCDVVVDGKTIHIVSALEWLLQ